MMTNEQLSTIKTRLKAATPGPWISPTEEQSHDISLYHGHSHDAIMMPITPIVDDWYKDGKNITNESNYVALQMNCYSKNYVNDSIFIAAARMDVELLIAEIERLQEMVKNYNDMVPKTK